MKSPRFSPLLPSHFLKALPYYVIVRRCREPVPFLVEGITGIGKARLSATLCNTPGIPRRGSAGCRIEPTTRLILENSTS